MSMLALLIVTSLVTLTSKTEMAAFLNEVVESLQIRLRTILAGNPRVVLVNLATLDPWSPASGSNRALQAEALTMAANLNPLSIAVDAAVGPSLGLDLNSEGFRLLDLGLEVGACLGIGHIGSADLNQVIGGDAYAAQIGLLLGVRPGRGERRMVYELQFKDEDQRVLPGLAKCVADKVGRTNLSLEAPWNVFLEFTDQRDFQDFSARTFPIDFSGVHEMRRNALDVRDLLDGSMRAVDVANAVVLLAYFDETDTTTIPGDPEPVYGSLAQAAAIDTLLRGPLYTLTPVGRILADLIIGGVLLTLVHCSLRRLRKNSHQRSGVGRRFRIVQGIALNLTVSTLMVGALLGAAGIIVPDLLLIAAGAYLHPFVERILHSTTLRTSVERILRRTTLRTFVLGVLSAVLPQATVSQVRLPQARIQSVQGKVTVHDQATSNTALLAEAGLELYAGQTLDCRGGSATIRIYGINVNGRLAEVTCEGTYFRIPAAGRLVSPALSRMRLNLIVFGRQR